MNDPRWDDPRPELFGDLDTVTFASSKSRGPSRRPPGWLVAVAAFAVGATVGAGAVYRATSGEQPESAQPIPTTTTVEKQAVVLPSTLRILADSRMMPGGVVPTDGSRAICHAKAGGQKHAAAAK